MTWGNYGVSTDRVTYEVLRALRSPGNTYIRGARRFSYEGDAVGVESLEGPLAFLDGVIHLDYDGTRALTLDFNRRYVKSYREDRRGRGSYLTNSVYLCARVLGPLFGLSEQEMDVILSVVNRWTPITGGATQERYAAGVSWASDDGVYWNTFSHAEANDFYSKEWKLRSAPERHWFMYDWDKEGVWALRYINDGAKVRHANWKKKWKSKLERMGSPTSLGSIT